MTQIVFGSESELVVAKSIRGDKGPVLVRAERVVLERLLALAADLFGVRATALGRLQLMDGAMLYIDGSSLEYATPPCLSWDDVTLHERDLEYLMILVVRTYEQEWGETLEVLQPGSGPGGELCGYHENYGMHHDDYFRLFYRTNFRPTAVWLQAIVPFLVTRILFTGSGGIRGGGFCISPRASAVTHVFHHSTSPERPIVHLKRPQLADEFLRVQITCGDANRMLTAIQSKLSITSAVLLGAARGIFDGLDLSLADPVTAMHDLSLDWRVPLPLSDGKLMSATEIQRALADRIVPASGLFREDEGAKETQGLLDVFDLWREIG